jgi:hypothetical protein
MIALAELYPVFVGGIKSIHLQIDLPFFCAHGDHKLNLLKGFERHEHGHRSI